MAKAKEIRRKIGSIKKTKKITSAMQMVAASKMRRVQNRMFASLPYANKLLEVVSHLANVQTEFQHVFLDTRTEVKKVACVVISTDRGLCGGLNNNLFKSVTEFILDCQAKNVAVDLCLIGKKATAFFKRFNVNIIASSDGLGDNPSLNDLVGMIKTVCDAYAAKEIDKLFVAHNYFVNTMVHKPKMLQLLPITVEAQQQKRRYWDYIYEPHSAQILDTLLKRYLEVELYQSVVANVACEQAARMMAMQSATENAADIINDLELIYNKERQAAITQEIAEIVGGAAAV